MHIFFENKLKYFLRCGCVVVCTPYPQGWKYLEIFRHFADGFLSMTANTLTPAEIDTLALSCLTLTVELSTRFLADYILGDPYFNTKCPEHNLIRTRCQIALAKDMQKKMHEMQQIVADCVAEARA